ncbi:MAG: pantetheine-phosphate adenylyltransferase [Bacteroidota bacterium]
MRIAVFPGSFDPFTIGHEDIIRRALPLFDQMIVAIGYNSAKKSMFDYEVRLKWIDEIFADEKKITVEAFEGLTVDFCIERKAQYILRGLRSSVDFEFEKAIGQMNQALQSSLETLVLICRPEHTHINSTIIRDIILHKGDVSAYVPKVVSDYLKGV